MINALIDFCARNKAVVFIATIFAILGAWYSIHNIALDAIPDLSDTQVILYT
jgi:Cu(I)/Ag(I) efflux system membrane protein CusA/SilA